MAWANYSYSQTQSGCTSICYRVQDSPSLLLTPKRADLAQLTRASAVSDCKNAHCSHLIWHFHCNHHYHVAALRKQQKLPFCWWNQTPLHNAPILLYCLQTELQLAVASVATASAPAPKTLGCTAATSEGLSMVKLAAGMVLAANWLLGSVLRPDICHRHHSHLGSCSERGIFLILFYYSTGERRSIWNNNRDHAVISTAL